MERLDKLLSSQGAGTRSEVQRLIRGGHVCVDGLVVRSPAEKVDPARCAVAVKGRELVYKEHLYIMLNKPAGILCVSRDPKAPTVTDLLPEEWRRRGMFPAGRLDKDTHELVLLTDDGDYAHRILSPKKAVFKRYRAVLDGSVTEHHIQLFRDGTSLPDGTPCLPAKLQVVEPGDTPLVEIEIQEGKYHQIKRMFSAVDRKVLWLKRYAIGGLTLDPSLAEGECRELTDEERASALV